MNLLLKVIFFLLVALYGCNQTSTSDAIKIDSPQPSIDTTYKEIYDFMKEIIVSESLDLTNRLETEPQPNCDLIKPDEEYLNNFLIIQNKSSNSAELSNGKFSKIIDLFDRCLRKDDINFMLNQKSAHRGFKWNNYRLGFNKENTNFWYIFSIPLFSKDKTKVIMMIRKGRSENSYI